MLFPNLKNKCSRYLNLDVEAQKWLAAHPSRDMNPLLDADTCQKFVEELNRGLGLDFSYGGYLEDRSTLWRGSYLDADERYIHLGVDFNVPAGTSVAVPRPCSVIRVDNDYPERHGWGTRVFLQEPGAEVVLLFAHLDQKIEVVVGDRLEAGSIPAKVGVPPYNGDWFPHLHVQVIEGRHYEKLLENDLRELDGYGRVQDIEVLKKNFRDPMGFLTIPL